MNESGIYTEADLKPYQSRLKGLKEIIKETDPNNLDRDQEERRGTDQEVEDELERDKAMTGLMFQKWDACGNPISLIRSPSLRPMRKPFVYQLNEQTSWSRNCPHRSLSSRPNCTRFTNDLSH